jgi:hypothetical protein
MANTGYHNICPLTATTAYLRHILPRQLNTGQFHSESRKQHTLVLCAKRVMFQAECWSFSNVAPRNALELQRASSFELQQTRFCY